MYAFLGDRTVGEVIFFPWPTYNSSGASVTLTGLAVTDIEVYKNASMTQRSSDAGYALVDTDGIDLDGITGIHGFTIDTGDNTDAGFFAAGNDYTVVVSSVTVDGQTVNLIVGRFTLEKLFPHGLVRVGAYPSLGIADSGTAQSATATTLVLRAASAAADDSLIGMTALVYGSTQGYWQSRIITDSDLATDTVTVDAWTVTPSGTITYQVIATPPGSAAAPAGANITHYNGVAVPDVDFARLLGAINYGTAQSATASTLQLASAASFANDTIIGSTILITGGTTGVGQARVVTDYDSATDTATVEPDWTVTPTGTIDYIAFASAPAPDTSLSAVNVGQINTVPITGNGSSQPFGV